MKNIHLADRLFNTPLMITEHKRDVLLSVMGPRLNIDLSGVQIDAREVDDNERRRSGYRVQSGVGIIPVQGTLVHKSGWLDAMSGVTSYQSIRQAFDTAMDDDAVKSIMLDVDSPGGEVSGVFDLADHIFASRGKKPMTAMVNESAYSAAYAIASAADRIIIPRTGGAGSVGVIATHVDFSRAEDAAGIKVTHILAGARKADGSPHAPLSDIAWATIQGLVDETHDLFVATVARNRGMSIEAVRKTEAGTFTGKKAVAVGFADEVAAADKTFSKLVKNGGSMAKKTNVIGAVAAGVDAQDTPADAAVAGTVEQSVVVDPVDQAAVQPGVSQSATESDASVAINSSTDTTAAALTAERARVSELFALCQANDMMSLFAGFNSDGVTTEQASARILEFQAMLGDQAGIVSRHNGQAVVPGAKIDTASIYGRLATSEGRKA